MFLLSRAVRVFAPAGVCIALAACIPETKTWLSERATATPDPRLVGVFIAADTAPERHMIVVEAEKRRDGKPSAVMHLVWAQLKPDNAEKTVVWASYRAWPARLPDGGMALNLERMRTGPFMAQLAPRRFFVIYDVDAKGRVTVRMPRNRSWSEAVQSGAVEGTVVKGRYLDQITLTASRAKLARYVAANQATLFESAGQTWRRIQ